MVWKYCRSISPEWKQQVQRARRQVWTLQQGQGSSRHLLKDAGLEEHFTPDIQCDRKWMPTCLASSMKPRLE